MRIFLDTEFIERPCTIDLVSIALVNARGDEYYAVSSVFDASRASPWVKKHVLSKLQTRGRISRAQIAKEIRRFIGRAVPEVWGYYADYDWVVFCWLFGTMMKLPEGWPMYCLDIKQRCETMGLSKEDLPPQPKDAHHALADARWNRDASEYLDRVEAGLV